MILPKRPPVYSPDPGLGLGCEGTSTILKALPDLLGSLSDLGTPSQLVSNSKTMTTFVVLVRS